MPASILPDTNVAVPRSTPTCIVPTLQSYGCWLQSQHQCKRSSARCTVAVADPECLNATVVADGGQQICGRSLGRQQLDAKQRCRHEPLPPDLVRGKCYKSLPICCCFADHMSTTHRLHLYVCPASDLLNRSAKRADGRMSLKHRHCLRTEGIIRGKRTIIIAILCCLMCAGAPAIALADTVYYKGSAVYWNYGRNAGVFGFSDCNSAHYEHHSSCNGYTSGWKNPDVLSQAWGFIGTDTLEAYWSCRG